VKLARGIIYPNAATGEFSIGWLIEGMVGGADHVAIRRQNREAVVIVEVDAMALQLARDIVDFRKKGGR
jgi:hypothetical protein